MGIGKFLFKEKKKEFCHQINFDLLNVPFIKMCDNRNFSFMEGGRGGGERKVAITNYLALK